MRSKFEVSGSVWYFDPNAEEIKKDKVEMIFANSEGIFYKLEESGLTLPEGVIFSCELQVKEHYKKIFL